jgi:hypothetical protein
MGKGDRKLRQCTVNEESLTPNCITRPQPVDIYGFLIHSPSLLMGFYVV